MAISEEIFNISGIAMEDVEIFKKRIPWILRLKAD